MRLLFSLMLLTFGLTIHAMQTSPMVSFHHLHLNSTDPTKAQNFYTRTFDVTSKTTLAGFPAVQSEKMFLLFDRVKKPPRVAPDSALWHFGWGSTAMESDYQRHLTNGVEFATPLTRLNANLQFAYMHAPDGALVEINTSATRAFIHAHLYSAAPLCAAEWYVKNLGATTRVPPRTEGCIVPFAAPSEPLGVIRSPAATIRFGDISLIIYPQQRSTPLVSSREHAIDHLGFAVNELDAMLKRLHIAGVKVLEAPHAFGKSSLRAAMIEGPDAIALELVEVR